MQLNIQESFVKELPRDPVSENFVRTVKQACFSQVYPTPCSQPQLLLANKKLASQIGLQEKDLSSKEFLEIFSGNKTLKATTPFAMNYGGHQFGHWAGQLGDGRAINLFEIVHEQQRWMLQLKGAGKTPYSRTADGLAVLRSSLREYLCSEAMYHLRVPTTRALSLMLTGDKVLRDMLYDGHPEYEPGAIIGRAAPTFIRFGNFQILAAQGDKKLLQQLADYTLKYFFPHIENVGKESYLQWFKEIGERTLNMIVEWERVGFVHGVMNTDNMSILGLTIDYGPYGWLDNFDREWTPNTTDAQGKRYRFGHQSSIAFWNLVQLANTLFPLTEDVRVFEKIFEELQKYYQQQYTKMMMRKLGLYQYDAQVQTLIQLLPELLQNSEMDMTIFFRQLSSFTQWDENWWEKLVNASYQTQVNERKAEWQDYFTAFEKCLPTEKTDERIKAMNQVNPKFVFRNYMAQLAIDAAEQEDYSLLKDFETLLQQPYEEQPDQEKWFAKRPDWAKDKPGSSMLSCSS